MSVQARRSPLQFLGEEAVAFVLRHPFVSMSVVAHVALLALLYYFGVYRTELREQQAEVASSLRATQVASTAKRLQDLHTIKQLLEKSANRAETIGGPEFPSAPPETPRAMVEQARELSKEIDALDQEIKAEELAQLLGTPEPPPVTEAPQEPAAEKVTDSDEPQDDANDARAPDDGTQEPTPEMAANEVAALEGKARATLAKRLQRMEAKENGVQIEGSKSGSGASDDGSRSVSSRGNDNGNGNGNGSGNGSGNDNRKAQYSAARAEIADFLANAEQIDEATQTQDFATGYADPSVTIFNHGPGEIPAVDAASLVLGRGRVLGAGGEHANRVYLNSWYVIGPFPGRHGADLFDNPSYPPEEAVLLDAAYEGKDKRLLRWRYVTAQGYPFYPPDIAEDSVYYGYTEVFVDEACELTAWIGSDDDVQIYLNDRLVWRGGNVSKQTYFDAIFNTASNYLRDYNRTEDRRRLRFEKGRNRIFFKLSNGPNRAFLSMVLTR